MLTLNLKSLFRGKGHFTFARQSALYKEHSGNILTIHQGSGPYISQFLQAMLRTPTVQFLQKLTL